jgi:ribosome maturation factor RimP
LVWPRIWGFIFGCFNMSDLRVKIQKMIQSSIEIMDYELIDVECHRGNKSLKIIVFIDHSNGIKIDDCVIVTNIISKIIDEDNNLMEHYNLEVSSPGLNRKLILNQHYDKFIGKDIRVKLKTKIDNRIIYKGILLERVDDRISIFENHQKITIQMDTIEVCRLVPAFE